MALLPRKKLENIETLYSEVLNESFISNCYYCQERTSVIKTSYEVYALKKNKMNLFIVLDVRKRCAKCKKNNNYTLEYTLWKAYIYSLISGEIEKYKNTRCEQSTNLKYSYEELETLCAKEFDNINFSHKSVNEVIEDISKRVEDIKDKLNHSTKIYSLKDQLKELERILESYVFGIDIIFHYPVNLNSKIPDLELNSDCKGDLIVKEIKKLYTQAKLVSSFSSRAVAVLLRVIIELLIKRELKSGALKLSDKPMTNDKSFQSLGRIIKNTNVKAFLEEKKRLSPEMYKTLLNIINFANNGCHELNNKNSFVPTQDDIVMFFKSIHYLVNALILKPKVEERLSRSFSKYEKQNDRQ